MSRWIYLAAAIVAEVVASMSLKAALELPPLYLVCVVGYTGAFALLSVALRRGLPLGVGYGVWGACGVALTAVMSLALFDEPLTGTMGVGIVLIMGGVLLVQAGAHEAARPKLHQEGR